VDKRTIRRNILAAEEFWKACCWKAEQISQNLQPTVAMIVLGGTSVGRDGSVSPFHGVVQAGKRLASVCLEGVSP